MISFFAKKLREKNCLPMNRILMVDLKYHAQIALLSYFPGQDWYGGISISFGIKETGLTA
ncbi:hypothetical protein [Janthinobacterium sp. MDT1-19]|uniref:hypothetical protein n=1 Tax=Janthinobacterium sp. MDT1-19 TaxID=1259339 RepID=UPI003F289697